MKTREELLEEVVLEVYARIESISKYYGSVNAEAIKGIILDEIEDRDLVVPGLTPGT